MLKFGSSLPTLRSEIIFTKIKGVSLRRSGGGEHQTEKRQPFFLFGLYVTPYQNNVVPKQI